MQRGWLTKDLFQNSKVYIPIRQINDTDIYIY